MQKMLFALVVIAGSGFFVSASAATAGPDELIAARQAEMKLHAALMGAMKRAVDEKIADVKPFKDAGDALAASGRALPGLFADGTDKGHDTKALPGIWSDRAGFEKVAANFVEAAQNLSKAASSGDQAGFASAFQATGQACGACHRTYRVR
jgi:cytochrome c556